MIMLVTPYISEEQKGELPGRLLWCGGYLCVYDLLQNLLKEVVKGNASHAFVHPHAMLVTKKVRKLLWFKVLDSYAGFTVLPNSQ